MHGSRIENTYSQSSFSEIPILPHILDFHVLNLEILFLQVTATHAKLTQWLVQYLSVYLGWHCGEVRQMEISRNTDRTSRATGMETFRDRCSLGHSLGAVSSQDRTMTCLF